MALNVEILKLPAFLGVFSLLFLAETLWSKRSWETPRIKRLAFHAGLSIFNTVMTRLFIVGFVIVLTQSVWERGWGLMGFLRVQGGLELFLTFFAYDVYNYWWHRANHAVPFLWRFHRIHHLDTQVDVTTSLRFHPVELFLSYGAKAGFVLLWGPSLAGFLIAEIGITAFSQFHHSNIDLGDRWEARVRRVYMTPRVHASHHTVTPRTRSANYSTIFLVWDKLFRSFQEPDFGEMQKLGLESGRDIYLSFLEILKEPFVRKD